MKEAEDAILKINSNLKTSENKRLTLSKQLEDKIQESELTARKLREKFSSTLDMSKSNNSQSYETDPQSELFHDINLILTEVFEGFKYTDFLTNLSFKEDKKLKDA